MDPNANATASGAESAVQLTDLGVHDPESLVNSYEHLPRVMLTVSSSMASDTTTTTVTSNPLTVSCFLGAVANLCSATLGAGILALPFAMYEAGLVFGVLLLIVSAWATASSIDLIIQACYHYKLGTYESVVEKALGSKWRQTVEISILLFCGGTAVGYVIAVGDIMERVNDMGSAGQKRLAMALVWLLAMLPLSCLRRMQSLQCASSIGIMSIGTLLVAAIVHLFVPVENSETEHKILGLQELKLFLWPHHGLISILRACPIFFFAYSCQVNVAQIFDELPVQRIGEVQHEGGDGRKIRVGFMRHVTWVAIGLCTLLYGSISLVTLIDFGDAILPNVLSCYRLSGRESALLHLAFLAMAVAVIMAFPLNIFPARLSIIQMWEAASAKRTERLILGIDGDEASEALLLQDSQNPSGTGYGSDEDASSPRSNGQDEDPLRSVGDEPAAMHADDTPLRQHQFVTLLVAGCALGLALVAPNISVVFGLLGGTTSSLLGFVVPGLLGLAMEGGSSSKVTSWVLVVAGTVIGVVTTTVTLYSTIGDAMHW